MADNITLNSGSGGSVIATDDISSVHYQIIKLAYGALNTATLVTTSAPLPVDIRAENASVTVDNGGTFVVQEDGDALTALQLIDNLVLAEDAAHQTGDPGVQMLAVRTASPADKSGTDGDYEPLQMDNGRLWVSATVDAALPAGTNAIGKLAANSGVDIGDVDVLSLPSIPTGSNTIGEVTIGAATTAAGDLAKAEDAAHSSGDVGVMALGVRDTSPAAVSGTDGDYEPFHVNDDGGLWVTLTPSHQGGWTPYSNIDLDESEDQVSATACTVSGFYFWNLTAAPLWVQLFNATAASIAPGSDAPDYNFPIPANADSDGAGITFVAGPFQFSTALSIAVTTGSGTNSGAPGANEAGVFLGYKN